MYRLGPAQDMQRHGTIVSVRAMMDEQTTTSTGKVAPLNGNRSKLSMYGPHGPGYI